MSRASDVSVDVQQKLTQITDAMKKLMEEENNDDELNSEDEPEVAGEGGNTYWTLKAASNSVAGGGHDEAEKTLLHKQLQDTATELGSAKDELHFTEHKLREATIRARELASQLESERMGNGGGRRSTLTGAQKFMVQKTIMIQKRSLQKKHVQGVQKLYSTLEGQERLLMFAEDRLLNPVEQVQQAQQPSAHSYMGNEKDGHQYIEVTRTDVSSVDDEYAEVKASQSSFATQLTQLKQSLKPILCEFKESSDLALTTLERILWPHVGRHPRPKEAFGKHARAHLVKSKMLLADGIRRLNNLVFDFVKEEKEVKKTWAKEYILSLPRNELGCQTDIPTGPTEEEVRLQAEVKMLKERIASMRASNAKSERQLSWDRDRAKLNLQFIQEKFVDLHRELYTALHQVYKHRFRWIDRHTDPLRVFTANRVSKRPHTDVQFNLGLGEVLTTDTEQLKRFGEYFTRDDLFGMDMSAKDAPQLTEKLSVPWKAGGKRAHVAVTKRRSSAMGKFVHDPEEQEKEKEKPKGKEIEKNENPDFAFPLSKVSTVQSQEHSLNGSPKHRGIEPEQDLEPLSKALQLALGDINKGALSLPKMPTVGAMPPLQPITQRGSSNSPVPRKYEAPHEDDMIPVGGKRRPSQVDSVSNEGSSASLKRVVIEDRREHSAFDVLMSDDHTQKPSPRPPSGSGSPRSPRGGGRPPLMRSVASAPVVHRQSAHNPRPSTNPKPAKPAQPPSTDDIALSNILSYSRNKSGWSSPPRFVSKPS